MSCLVPESIAIEMLRRASSTETSKNRAALASKRNLNSLDFLFEDGLDKMENWANLSVEITQSVLDKKY